MNTQQQGVSLTSYPSLISSSIFNDEISIKNDLPFQMPDGQGTLNFALQSFSEANIGDLQLKSHASLGRHHLQLGRSTSFEQILMENHRTALIEAIRQYFQNTQHPIVQQLQNTKWTNPKLFTANYLPSTLEEAETTFENTLLANDKVDQAISAKILARLTSNADQVKIITDLLSICPHNIQFEVVYLFSFLCQQSNDIIEHFKPKLLARELKDKSDLYAKQLRQTPCLEYLFETDSRGKVENSFRILVEKWMITLFLMKVGVFENELKNHSIQEYLQSEVFSNIDINDLLNQHLIHPYRKARKTA